MLPRLHTGPSSRITATALNRQARVTGALVGVQLGCMISTCAVSAAAPATCGARTPPWAASTCRPCHETLFYVPGVVCLGAGTTSSKRGGFSRVPVVQAQCRLVLRPTGVQKCKSVGSTKQHGLISIRGRGTAPTTSQLAPIQSWQLLWECSTAAGVSAAQVASALRAVCHPAKHRCCIPTCCHRAVQQKQQHRHATVAGFLQATYCALAQFAVC